MKNMDRWLGSGGMPLIAELGAQFVTYGISEDGTSYAEAQWCPTALSSNPHGAVQGGVQAVLLDAAMNFAVNAGLEGRDRTRATLEMKTEMMRAASAGEQILVHGQAVRVARQVAWAEGRLLGADGQLLSRATATFLLHREV